MDTHAKPDFPSNLPPGAAPASSASAPDRLPDAAQASEADEAGGRIGPEAGAPSRRVCIVTGLSGSGKSTAMQVFEDLGYFTVDGLPSSMAAEMVKLMEKPSMAHFKGIVLGLDIRETSFLDEIQDALEALRHAGYGPELMFLEADTPEIMRRYVTTRRPHPLEREGIGLERAVHLERTRLAGLRGSSDMVVNTTRFSIHDLRRVIQRRFRSPQGGLRALRVNVFSFGFKYGIPAEADYVFDLRFLPNPYFVSELRARSGQDPEVSDYVFATPKAREFRAKLLDLLFYMKESSSPFKTFVKT
ncbi:MAG: RNase adapter RapZ [Desulfovibrio sp.]|nr:RNase adapter RapZ [Desulfovibrio sp.]